MMNVGKVLRVSPLSRRNFNVPGAEVANFQPVFFSVYVSMASVPD